MTPNDFDGSLEAGSPPPSNLIRLRQLLTERARERHPTHPSQAASLAAGAGPPNPPPPAHADQTDAPARPSGPIPETDLWAMIVQIARSRRETHMKSFLVNGRIAFHYDTLHGMLTSAVRDKGPARHIGNDGFDRVLRDHGVRVDHVQPPAGWGTSAMIRCCLFPLSVFQTAQKIEQDPQAVSEHTAVPIPAPGPMAGQTSPPAAQVPEFPAPPSLSAGEEDLVGQMRRALLDRANQFLSQGKVLTIGGGKAVRISDLCAFYPPWNEAKMGLHLKLLDIPTSRPWIQAKKGKVTVWFAWG